MTRSKSWVLTDVAGDLWIDSFAVSNDSLRLPTPHDWSIRKSTLRGGLRDGVDVIEVHNGALSYTILPTRGMGLWRGEYRGNYLGWRSPVQGPVHPKYVNATDHGGLGWLTGFDEWVVRCGLASNGPPGEDVVTHKDGRTSRSHLTLHGKIANRPAHYVEVRVGLDPPFELTVIGHVQESGLFLPHLHLTSTVTTVPGSNRVVIHDVIENRAAGQAETQLLYHVNVGPPFLEAGSRFLAPIRECVPLTARAAEGIDTFETYLGPTRGYTEQNYGFDLIAGDGGRTLAMLANAAADRGLVLRFRRDELPCFTIWKNTQAIEDGYVTGIEPATNFPNFRSFERKNGRVRVLSAGGKWEATLAIEAHDTRESVAGVLAEIATLQSHARRTVHRTPQPAWSPVSS